MSSPNKNKYLPSAPGNTLGTARADASGGYGLASQASSGGYRPNSGGTTFFQGVRGNGKKDFQGKYIPVHNISYNRAWL
jgi:hypothetical protein